MDEAIKMQINYCERGTITTKRAEETQYLFLDIRRDPEAIKEYQDSFEKDISKAISMIGKESKWNCEVTFFSCTSFYHENRYALVHREAGDEENGVYTFYRYGMNTVDKKKITKAKLLKELIKLERQYTESLLEHQTGGEGTAV